MAFQHIAHPRKRAFLCAYAVIGRVKYAAAHAKVSREAHYDWKREDPEYRAAFEAAEAMAADALVDEAKRRAQFGTEEYILYQGEVVTREKVDADGVVTRVPLMKRRYSDALLQFLIEGLKSDTFHERREIEHKAPEPLSLKVSMDVAHQFDLSGLAEEELSALERIIGKVAGGKIAGASDRGSSGTPPSNRKKD